MADEVHCLRCGDRVLAESLPAPGISLCRRCLEGARARPPWFLDPVGPPEARRRGLWPILAMGSLAGVLWVIFPLTGDRIDALLAVIAVLLGSIPLLALNKFFGYPGLKRRIASAFGLPVDLEGASLVGRLDGTSFLHQAYVPGTTEMGLLLVSEGGLVFIGERGGTLAVPFTPAATVRRARLAVAWPYWRGVRVESEGRTISFCPLEPRRGAAYERLLARAGAA